MKFPEIDNADGREWFTVFIFSENTAGVLNQVTNVFTRRQINIESLNVSPSGIKDIHRYTVTCLSDEETMKKTVKQIEKKIDVVQARFFREDDIYIMEQGLYKISTPVLLENHNISKTIRQYGAKIVEVNATYSIVSLEGLPTDIRAVYAALKEAGSLLQFVSSGIVAVTKSPRERLTEFLELRKMQEDDTKE